MLMTTKKSSSHFNDQTFDSDFYEKMTDSLQVDKAIWESTCIVFDTSALLDLYKYSKEACESLFEETFKNIEGCFWIPKHVEYEYILNRSDVIENTKNEYQKLNGSNAQNKSHTKSIQDSVNSIKNNVQGIEDILKDENIHPYIDSDVCRLKDLQENLASFEEIFQTFQDRVKNQVDRRFGEIDQVIREDYILDYIGKFFKVGREFSFDEQLRIVEEGEIRFRNKIPPGYMDSALGGVSGKNVKEGLQQYGDLIIWKQILEYAKEVDKDIMLVINDRKCDWCYSRKKSSRIERPREELVLEFAQYSERRFWMYTLSDFIYHLNKHPDIKVSSRVSEETNAIEEKIDADFQKESSQKESLINNGELPIVKTIDFLKELLDYTESFRSESNSNPYASLKEFVTVVLKEKRYEINHSYAMANILCDQGLVNISQKSSRWGFPFYVIEVTDAGVEILKKKNLEVMMDLLR